MSVQAYLRWDGMGDADRAAQDYKRGDVWVLDHNPNAEELAMSYLEGYAGFLHDFNGMTPTAALLPPAAYGSEPAGVPVTVDTLLSRLLPALREIGRQEAQELMAGRCASFFGFITRVHELEQAGLNPRVYVSW